MIIYLNGEFVPAQEARISVFDGGFMYGDGIYTTLRLYQGQPLDLAAHHARLASHTAELQITLSLLLPQLRAVITELVKHNNLEQADGRLRITVSRQGNPACPLPLHGLADIPATVVITLTPVSSDLARWQREGISVISLPAGSSRGNFPALKTLNALATVSALRQAAAAGCQEALLTGSDGHLQEGAVSNIFLVCGDHLVTPVSEGQFLAGRTRERILQIAAAENISVRQKNIDKRHLTAACEVFVVSSVREVLPVIQVDGRAVGDKTPGPVTELLQKKYRAAIQRELRDQT